MMKKVLVGAMTLVVAGLSASGAFADGRSGYYAPTPHPAPRPYPPAPPPPVYPPAPPPSIPSVDCLCTRSVVFYGPTSGYGDITVSAPGVRVYGEPVVVPSGRIDIKGPPVYVDAPPVRVAAPQIYLHRPEVYVRPSAVTVEAPEVHFTGCADGVRCEPAPRH
ncbi:hypothetical protein [uncultured Caulobacter sp.]|uniref:hypothetical protein n=1 Tax=uncultured Caulobacter sp. TaxID=158749 RepID=UPI0026295388|nr:hypothetical protein [uncultured Caulobacter sp.]